MRWAIGKHVNQAKPNLDLRAPEAAGLLAIVLPKNRPLWPPGVLCSTFNLKESRV